MENMGKIGRQQLSVAEETFGLIPADSALVRQVLEEDLQEDLEEDLYDA
jgi:hypothetical protein